MEGVTVCSHVSELCPEVDKLHKLACAPEHTAQAEGTWAGSAIDRISMAKTKTV